MPNPRLLQLLTSQTFQKCSFKESHNKINLLIILSALEIYPKMDPRDYLSVKTIRGFLVSSRKNKNIIEGFNNIQES